MSAGSLARKFLGDKCFGVFAEYYRFLFVDLRVVARSIAPYVPKDAHLLDIGGGDGVFLNFLLALRPDIRVTMIDLSPRLGVAVEKRFRDFVEIRPATTIRQYAETAGRSLDCILISDVVHHVPVAERVAFFKDVGSLTRDRPIGVIVKEVEPGYFRSLMGLLADRYISGDRNTVFIPRTELKRIVGEAFGPMTEIETDLFKSDKPNYAVVFRRG